MLKGTDPSSMLSFLSLIWGTRDGNGELRVMHEGIVESKFFKWPSETPRLLAYLGRMIPEHDVFFGVGLRRYYAGDASSVYPDTEWLWADLDKKRGIDFSDVLYGLVIPPEVIVDSGNGWHLYWHLARPVDFGLATKAMAHLATVLHGDKVGDAARIMRMPGTLNHKTNPAKAVRLLRMDTVTRHEFHDFDMPSVEERHHREYFGEDTGEWKVSPEDAPPFPDGERNNQLTKLAGAMLAKEMSPDEMYGALLAENDLRCKPPLPESEVMHIVESVLRYR